MAPFASSPHESRTPPQVPDHELLRCIGSGAFGEVWLARNVMGTYRAIKFVYRETFQSERSYEREYHGIEMFEPISRSHDGFVDILQAGRNDAAGYYFYVMELGDDVVFGQKIRPLLYQAKTLERAMGEERRLPLDECVRLASSLATALSHLHGHGLVHRDIKPANIIFVNGIPKIADIGLVVEIGPSVSTLGTPGFMPPERPGTAQGDIYSLGKVLYEISTGLDRREFPELPANLEISAQDQFAELNQIIIRACEEDRRRRYQTADQMHRDLLILQAGKSVKRLHLLEERLDRIKKVGAICSLLAILGAAVVYMLWMAEEEIQQRVGRNVAYGNSLIAQGDYLGALPPFVEALNLDQKNSLRQVNHRIRIASVLQQCPRLVEMWFLPTNINRACLSADRQYFMAAAVDGTVVSCDLTKGSTPTIMFQNRGEIEDVSDSQDGRFGIASGSEFARVWDRLENRPGISISPPGTVYSARFSPDGKWIVTASGGPNDGYVQLWDAATGKNMGTIASANSAYRFASFSPDGNRLITASEGKIAQVWDMQTRKPIGEPIRHPNWVFYAAFSPDGERVVTASQDGSVTVQVCDATTGRQIIAPFKVNAGAKSAEFSPDGRYIVAACWDYTTRIWSLTSGTLAFPFLKQSGKHVVYAAFTKDGHHVLTANANGVICLWDLATPVSLPAPARFYYSKDGDRYATIQDDKGNVRTTVNNSSISTFQTSLPVQEAKLNRDGTRLLTVSFENRKSGSPNAIVQLWNGLTGQPQSAPFPLPPSTVGVLLSDDGKRLVIRAETNVFILNATNGQVLVLLPHPGAVRGCRLSGDGRFLVTVSGTNAKPTELSTNWHRLDWDESDNISETDAYLWETSSGKLLHVLSHQFPVVYADFSPDGKRLVTCSSDSTLFGRMAQLWDVRAGKKIGSPLDHGDGVLYAAFRPDGKRIITASEDTTVRLWDAWKGRRLLRPLSHPMPVTEACFSEDGHWIASACRDDRTARIWDAETGEPITPPLRNPWPFRHVQFVRGSRAIIAQNFKGDSMLWPLALDDHKIKDLASLARLLSGNQQEYTGSLLSRELGSLEPLQDAWTKLQKERPTDFTVSKNEIIDWYLREAEASEKEKLWKAALFHWDRLNEIKPGFFEERGNLAREKAGQQAEDEPR